MHALEKILAAHAGKAEVRAGEIVNCHVDVAGINDLYLQTIYSFFEIEGTQVANPEGVVVFLDHYAPPSTVKQAQNQKEFREFCCKQGIEGLMEINQGVCHQVLVDKGYSRPGRLMVVTDSHTTTHGAFGAFSTGVGATDMACILKTGMLWFRVPEVMRVTLKGRIPKGISAKDIILHIIGDLGADFAVYKGVEFTGEVIGQLGISERMTLCNMTTEMGAKASYIQPDEITRAYLEEHGINEYTVYETDADYPYWKEYTYDVSELKPQLAVPSSVDYVENVSDYVGTKIHQAFLGSCTGGKLEDLAAAAQIIKGRQIAKGVRMLVVPASREVLLKAMELGYMKILIDAGATFVTPGCAACLGTHEGIIADGEVCISSTNRNFPGRMGGGTIYLASPAVVAASALEGKIADPYKYMREVS